MDSPDVYRCLADTIDARLGSLAGPTSSDNIDRPSAEEIEAELLHLNADRATVRRHSVFTDQPVTYGEATFCQECGEPTPCETIRLLSEQYGCGGPRQ
jgi:formylmethanofuran dehydrogenase subunit E